MNKGLKMAFVRCFGDTKEERWKQQLFSCRYISPEGCWIWTGATNGKKNYGIVSIDSKKQYVHRIAAKLWLKDYSDDLCVLHNKCDFSLCFNPDHLKMGTVEENNKEMFAKGRDQFSKYRELKELLRKHEENKQKGTATTIP
jgi:hypothetical protein